MQQCGLKWVLFVQRALNVHLSTALQYCAEGRVASLSLCTSSLCLAAFIGLRKIWLAANRKYGMGK